MYDLQTFYSATELFGINNCTRIQQMENIFICTDVGI